MVFSRGIKLLKRVVFWACVFVGALSVILAVLAAIYWPTLKAKYEAAQSAVRCDFGQSMGR